jgi:excisionase family DNA binding protein
MQQEAVEPKLLRLEQAGAALGVSHWTLRIWAKQGKLRTIKLGHLRLVPVDELERIAQQGIGGGTSHREQRHGRTT